MVGGKKVTQSYLGGGPLVLVKEAFIQLSPGVISVTGAFSNRELPFSHGHTSFRTVSEVGTGQVSPLSYLCSCWGRGIASGRLELGSLSV